MAVIYGPGSNASDVVLFPLWRISTQETDCRDAQISVFALPDVIQVMAGRLLRWPGVLICWKEVYTPKRRMSSTNTSMRSIGGQKKGSLIQRSHLEANYGSGYLYHPDFE